MKIFFKRLPLPILAVVLVGGCANSSSDIAGGPGTGPFDSEGNYREDWADDPSKWRRPGSTASGEDLPQIASAEQPPLNANPLGPQTVTPVRSQAETPRETVRRPQPTATASVKPKPKPKPVAKPKPKQTRYVVKKGDSLYVIARRHKSSVAAIQRANRIKGSLIRPGQSLVIPR